MAWMFLTEFHSHARVVLPYTESCDLSIVPMPEGGVTVRFTDQNGRISAAHVRETRDRILRLHTIGLS